MAEKHDYGNYMANGALSQKLLETHKSSGRDPALEVDWFSVLQIGKQNGTILLSYSSCLAERFTHV